MKDSEPKQEELVFPASYAAETLRSGPYRNSVNALAEIVDNSYDAEASEIHIALIYSMLQGRTVMDTIAVLDNGLGMDQDTLRRSIQHGRHQAINNTGRKRIGKFGVGLLSASFNQCKDLEVYSWDNGLREEVNSTRIHVENCPHTLPPVEKKQLPPFYIPAFSTFSKRTDLETHGTLVIWRDIDNLSWKLPETLMSHVESEVGRIYRNFINEEKLKITISIIEMKEDGSYKHKSSSNVQAVDPLFLQHWDCPGLKEYREHLEEVERDPEKYGVSETELRLAKDHRTLFIPFDYENENDNAFNEDGTIKATEVTVNEDGKELGKYRIMASYRWPRVVRAAAATVGEMRNPGNTKYGKLAEDMRGVSILRGGRELALDVNWLRADQTIDRWISLSFDFDPSLDSIFGVSNNKQHAAHLSAMAQVNAANSEDTEFNKHVLTAARIIQKFLGRMRNLVSTADRMLEIDEAKTHFDPAYETITQLKVTTVKIAKRAKREGHEVSGIDDTKPDQEKLKEGYKDAVYEGEKASETRPEIVIQNNLKVDIVTDPVASDSYMFSPTNNASGAMIIRLNANHPFYDTLRHIRTLEKDLESSSEELTKEEMEAKLNKAFTVIQGMIIGFSRAELEATPQHKLRFERVRQEWSFVTKDLFDEEDD